MHIDNKGKDILILGKGPAKESDDTTLTVLLNILLILHDQIENLHYKGSNSFLVVNATKIYQFKVKNSEIKISLVF